MSKSVAVDGEVTAEVATDHTDGHTGTWTAQPIEYETYDHVTIGSKEAIWQARCTFNFLGKDASNNPVTDVDTVTLSAVSTVVRPGPPSQNVLLDGDKAEGAQGAATKNTLRVQAAGPLKTEAS